jgi:predicted RNA-binding protein (virulence factor B family)
VEFGVYLDDDDRGILLPKRFVPEGVQVDDMIEVFIYHDGEDKLIATTQKPFVKVNEIGYLKVVNTTAQGAFLDWGLMKDLFVPISKQQTTMYRDVYYFVQLYIDAQTGRVAAHSKIDAVLKNDDCVIKELEPVHLRIYRESNIGYMCIVNHQYEGLLHYADVFQKVYDGDAYTGYVKKVYANNNKLDVMLGKPGYQKVEDEAEKIIRLLHENNGYLPYHDKSAPEDIYDFFGMSKKVFKMTLGNLYKSKKIEMVQAGIKLVE